MRLALMQMCGVVAGLVVAGVGTVQAAIYTGTGVNSATGQTLNAAVEFTVSGSSLIVALTNTGEDVLAPTDLLSGVFFSLADDITLTPVSATLADGSTVLFGTTDPGNMVGGEWAYKNGLTGTNGGGTQGISSTGLGLFGPGDVFGGSNLQGPASPDGDQYAITSAADDPSTGNSQVTGAIGLIQNSVVFVLSGLSDDFDVDTDITNVVLQYGSALTDPYLTGTPDDPVPLSSTPEPVSVMVWAGVAASLLLLRRRKHNTA